MIFQKFILGLLFIFLCACTSTTSITSLNSVSSVDITSFSEVDQIVHTKVFSWNCTSSVCNFRIKLSNSNTFEFTNETYRSTKTLSIDHTSIERVYYLYVQAKDSEDNVSRVYKAKITVDHTAPAINSTFVNPINILNSASNHTLTGSCDENSNIFIEAPKLTGTSCTATPCSGVTQVSCTSGTWSSSISTGTLADGNYTITTYATDSAGNTSLIDLKSFTKDTIRPTFVTTTPLLNSGIVNSGNMGSYSISGTCSDNSQSVQFTGSVTASALCSGNSWSHNFDFSAAADGALALNVNYADSAGNSAIQQTLNLTKTTSSGLIATLSGQPTSTSKAVNLNVTVGGTSITEYSFKVGLAATTDCTSPLSYSGFSVIATPITTDISGEVDGALRLCVLGKDSGGNTQDYNSATIYNWNKDTTSPVAASSLTLGAEFSSASNSPTLSWTNATDAISGVASQQIQVVDSSSAVIVSWQSHTSGQTLTGLSLSPGKYHFNVRAIDNVGNPATDSANSSEWVVCPTNYIYVPGLAGFSTSGFCAAKYEAKNVSNVGTSQVAGKPEVSISEITAEARCQANTPSGKYDLLSQNEWMNLARNIESSTANWSSGVVGSGFISIGHLHWNASGSCTGSGLYGATDGTDLCTDNPPSSDLIANSPNYADFFYRRTHTLTNGEIIWDLAGNVNEWVRGYITTPQSNTGYADDFFSNKSGETLQFTMNDGKTGTSYQLFGPVFSVTACNNNPDNYCGIGRTGLNFVSTPAESLVRGGAWGNDGSFGLYSITAFQNNTDTDTRVGYRCVFHP